MEIFYKRRPWSEPLTLDDEEARHALQVLRMRPGDRLKLTDGEGTFAEVVIREIEKKHLRFELLNERVLAPEPRKFHLGIAPVKSPERNEWMLEKLTEIGVTSIHILRGEHSVRREVKIERWQKIMISAMKQSERAYLPVLHPPVSFDDALLLYPSANRYIAHCADSDKIPALALISSNETYVLIGPEGDFSRMEIDKAVKAGFKAMSLGESRLRTETAAVVTGVFHAAGNMNPAKSS